MEDSRAARPKKYCFFSSTALRNMPTRTAIAQDESWARYGSDDYGRMLAAYAFAAELERELIALTAEKDSATVAIEERRKDKLKHVQSRTAFLKMTKGGDSTYGKLSRPQTAHPGVILDDDMHQRLQGFRVAET